MTDLFTDVQETPEIQPDDEGKYHSVIVGEGKKYADDEALAKSIIHKEVHISKIEQENAELRQQLSTVRSVEEILADQQNNVSEPSEPNTNGDDTALNQGLSEADVEKKIEARIEAVRQADLAEDNVKRVVDFVSKSHGANARTAWTEKAKEVGMSSDDLQNLAKANPSLVMNLFNKPTEASPMQNAPVSSTTVDPSKMSMNREGKPTEGLHKSSSQWAAVRKENGGKLSREDTIKEMEDALAMGESFFD